jgi:nucleoside-diphosphate-sugar epimerase
LETASQERFDAYGFGKLKQEEIVREYAKHHRLPCVTLRPGYVFGAGKQELNGRVGIKVFGPFIQVNPSNLLPLTYVDNCAEAIVLAGLTPAIDGEVFNIVDDDLLTARQFLKTYKVARRFRSVSVPYWVAYSAFYAWERYSKWSKGQLPPAFNRRRCVANWKSQRYSNEKLKTRLGWKPRVPMKQAMETFLAQFGTNSEV